jgi:hypothetical protein
VVRNRSGLIGCPFSTEAAAVAGCFSLFRHLVSDCLQQDLGSYPLSRTMAQVEKGLVPLVVHKRDKQFHGTMHPFLNWIFPFYRYRLQCYIDTKSTNARGTLIDGATRL